MHPGQLAHASNNLTIHDFIILKNLIFSLLLNPLAIIIIVFISVNPFLKIY